jgi:hypothetical protein
MYQKQSGLVLGCDLKIQKQVINSITNVLAPSKNDYDWLGHGIYFWENSPQRALSFAKEVKKREGSIQTPAVIGAVLSLGKCLDLLDSENLQLVKEAYEELKEIFEKAGAPLPQNKGTHDLLLRPLDCFVIEHLLKDTDFDSVRGLFPEGKELYEGAGFREKDHIQICIRNANCIKGYFLPRRGS